MSKAVGIMNMYRSFVKDFRERRAERRTLAAIADLPPHLLKDIGWPGGYDHQPRPRGR